jgi:hypothetical protein
MGIWSKLRYFLIVSELRVCYDIILSGVTLFGTSDDLSLLSQNDDKDWFNDDRLVILIFYIFLVQDLPILKN